MLAPAALRPVATLFDPRFVLDTGRIALPKVGSKNMSFAMRGEFQLRFRANSDLRLEPRIGQPDTNSLGQNYYLYQWLRLKPVFQYRDKLKIVGEIDIPRGIVVGQTTDLVTAARDDMSELRWYGIQPRQLYLEYLTPIGLFRVGQQTSSWGMGLLANGGDTPTLFGDYNRGSIVERLLFATKPLGKDEPLLIALGGDLVYQDGRASLVGDIPADRTPSDELRAPDDTTANANEFKGRDRALQAVGAVRWKTDAAEIGVYGVFRHQERDSKSVNDLTMFTEELQVGVVNLAGKFNAPVPGTKAFVFGEMEVSYIGGSTTYVRNIDLTASGEEEAIQSFGGAVKLGAARVHGSGKDAWGDVVVAVEYGYASGDADPTDGTTRRFTFDPNHNVGLVLFDQVMAWKTARSATVAQDPQVTFRPAPGLEFLPSNGGIFGATYLNPTLVVRPKRWLDLKGGIVIAQTTADFVDPYRVGKGDFKNYDGGDEHQHNLGIEMDLGIDARIPIGEELVVQTGAEGGVLFPGGAFDDADGEGLANQYALNVKLGAQF